MIFDDSTKPLSLSEGIAKMRAMLNEERLAVPRFMSAEQAAEYVRREYPSMLKAIREDVLGARNDLACKLLELTSSEKQAARAYAELLRGARIDL